MFDSLFGSLKQKFHKIRHAQTLKFLEDNTEKSFLDSIKYRNLVGANMSKEQEDELQELLREYDSNYYVLAGYLDKNNFSSPWVHDSNIYKQVNSEKEQADIQSLLRIGLFTP